MKRNILNVVVVFCVFGCVLAAVAKEKPSTEQPESDEIDLEAIMNECNETFTISNEYLIALNETGSFPDETDKTPKCYVKCVMEKITLMDEGGEFNIPIAIAIVADSLDEKDMKVAAEIIAGCLKDRNETCHCERAYEFTKCTMESVLHSDEN